MVPNSHAHPWIGRVLLKAHVYEICTILYDSHHSICRGATDLAPVLESQSLVQLREAQVVADGYPEPAHRAVHCNDCTARCCAAALHEDGATRHVHIEPDCARNCVILHLLRHPKSGMIASPGAALRLSMKMGPLGRYIQKLVPSEPIDTKRNDVEV